MAEIISDVKNLDLGEGGFGIDLIGFLHVDQTWTWGTLTKDLPFNILIVMLPTAEKKESDA